MAGVLYEALTGRSPAGIAHPGRRAGSWWSPGKRSRVDPLLWRAVTGVLHGEGAEDRISAAERLRPALDATEPVPPSAGDAPRPRCRRSAWRPLFAVVAAATMAVLSGGLLVVADRDDGRPARSGPPAMADDVPLSRTAPSPPAGSP